MIWLRFCDQNLERRFRRKQNDRRRHLDEIAVLIHLLPIFLASFKAWKVKTALIEKLALPLGLLSLSLAVLLNRWRPTLYVQHRDKGVLHEKPDASWAHFLTYEILHYGKGIPLLMTGLVMILNLKEHVITMSGITALVILYNPSTCQVFYERMPENRGKYVQLSAMLQRFFSSPFLLLGIQPSWQTHSEHGGGHDNCLRIQAFQQIVFGFVLPTLIVYGLEVKSRLAFQREILGLAPEKSLRWSRAPAVLNVLLGLANLYVGLAILWHFLGWVLILRGP